MVFTFEQNFSKKMVYLEIELVDPRAETLLIELANLNLIRIKNRRKAAAAEFLAMVEKIKSRNSNHAVDLDEITAEVEAVRAKNFEHELSPASHS